MSKKSERFSIKTAGLGIRHRNSIAFQKGQSGGTLNRKCAPCSALTIALWSFRPNLSGGLESQTLLLQNTVELLPDVRLRGFCLDKLSKLSHRLVTLKI